MKELFLEWLEGIKTLGSIFLLVASATFILLGPILLAGTFNNWFYLIYVIYLLVIIPILIGRGLM